MSQLIHLVYCSAAKYLFNHSELTDMLAESRQNNHVLGVTGVLLYTDGSFFQVLEGEKEVVETLFSKIKKDDRHNKITIIIKEPIPKRSFGDWSMGFVSITQQEADDIIGANDFFTKGESFAQLSPGRTKKILAAFRQGRWRSRLSNTATLVPQNNYVSKTDNSQTIKRNSSPFPLNTWYSFAYQPIIKCVDGTFFAYEALLRGLDNQPANHILKQVPSTEFHIFEEQSRTKAIKLAIHKGLSSRLSVNFSPKTIEKSPSAIDSILETLSKNHLSPDQIILEILESEIINDNKQFKKAINQYQSSGLIFAIDDFGAGYAGLNLLADFQPNIIKLDMHLVRNIENNGPRQAILYGIIRTCFDLGIDIIAEGVETVDEYRWLRAEGIELFQGYLFAKPAFEALPVNITFPS